jgi:CRP/FNR family transcriptional regulator
MPLSGIDPDQKRRLHMPAAKHTSEPKARPEAARPSCCHAHQSCLDCKVRLISVCAALATDELREIEALARRDSLDAKQTLFLQNDRADAVYNVTDGVVRLYKLLPDGRRQIVGFALPGDFLGLAMSDRYGFCADAVDRVSVCRFARDAFSRFVDEKPQLLRRLHAFATHELSLAHEQMLLLGRRTAEEKIAAFLMGLRERWARLSGLSVTIPLPMSRQDMADFLGLTIETVSRTMTRLARERAILIVPGGVRLLDQRRMQQLAGA